MEEWIERRFQELMKKEQREAEERRQQEHRAHVVKTKASEFMKRVVDAAESQASNFNERFSGRTKLDFQRTPHGFDISRPVHPAVEASCVLGSESTSVRILIVRTGDSEARSQQQELALTLDADPDDYIVAKGEGRSFSHPERLAGFVLETALFGSSS
jgi:hypothetical protein